MQREYKKLVVLYAIVLGGFGVYSCFFYIFSEHHRVVNPQNYLYRIKKNLESGNFEKAEREIREALETFRPPDPEVFEILKGIAEKTKKSFGEERIELRKKIYEIIEGCGLSNDKVEESFVNQLKTELRDSYSLDRNQKQVIRSMWKNLIAKPWRCFSNIELNESEILDLFILAGAEISFDSTIGDTGVKFEGDVLVLSEGSSEGSGAQIWYQGRNYGGNRRGFYVMVLTPSPQRVIRSDRFDVWESKNEALRMVQFLDEVPEGSIGIFAVSDEASENMTLELEKALIGFGFAKKTYDGWEKKIFGYSYAFAGIGVKGAKEGSAIQNWARYEPGKNNVPVAIIGILKGVAKR